MERDDPDKHLLQWCAEEISGEPARSQRDIDLDVLRSEVSEIRFLLQSIDQQMRHQEEARRASPWAPLAEELKRIRRWVEWCAVAAFVYIGLMIRDWFS